MEFPYSIISTEPGNAAAPIISLPAALKRSARSEPRGLSPAAEGALAATVLSIIAMAIHGYHPYAEDGGLYFTAVLKALRPALYPSWSDFASVQRQYSLFAPMVAGFIRFSRLPTSVAIFLLDILSVWAIQRRQLRWLQIEAAWVRIVHAAQFPPHLHHHSAPQRN